MNSFMGALFLSEEILIELYGLPGIQVISKKLGGQGFGLDGEFNLIIQRCICFFALLFQPIWK